MTIPELITQFTTLGVVLEVRDGRLRVDAPKGVLTQELRAMLTANKAAVLAALEAEATRERDAHARAERLGVIDYQPSTSRWPTTDEVAAMPESLRPWVVSRVGWSPSSWAGYLRTRANNCDNLELCRLYSMAADTLSPVIQPTPRRERETSELVAGHDDLPRRNQQSPSKAGKGRAAA